MPKDTADIRTKAYVLRRTNYGEADRILNLITPEGKISAIAKGVRKPKSKLAGGVEMFSLTEVNLHKGRGDLMTVTSAKMLEYYGNLLKNYELMELATLILKKISLASENLDAPEYFSIVDASFKGLNDGVNPDLVFSWVLLNMSKVSGEEMNLYRDTSGEKLDGAMRYNFNSLEGAFEANPNGRFGAEGIKILRLMMTAKLNVVARIKGIENYLPEIVNLAKIASKMM